MDEYVYKVKFVWLCMFEPPWRHPELGNRRKIRWFAWLFGWYLALIGLIGGALAAPSLVQLMGLARASYADWLMIAIAVLASFLVQVVTWGIVSVDIALEPKVRPDLPLVKKVLLRLTSFIPFLLFIAPFTYGLYRYVKWIETEQPTALIAFVGGLLLKTLVIPAIVGAVRSRAFKLFMRWLRGKTTEAK